MPWGRFHGRLFMLKWHGNVVVSNVYCVCLCATARVTSKESSLNHEKINWSNSLLSCLICRTALVQNSTVKTQQSTCILLYVGNMKISLSKSFSYHLLNSNSTAFEKYVNVSKWCGNQNHNHNDKRLCLFMVVVLLNNYNSAFVGVDK